MNAGAPLTIRQVDMARAGDRRLFSRLPETLYKGLPGYAPPLRAEEENILNPARNPFFRRNEAAFFIAERGGVAAGRICAHRLAAHDGKYGAGQGFFGYFDASADREAARCLLASAEEWHRQRGAARLAGPFSFSVNDMCGLQVSGHGGKPFLKLPFHPEWLEEPLRQSGYGRVKTLLCARHETARGVLSSRLEKLMAGEADFRKRLSLRPLTRGGLWRQRAALLDLYNESYAANWHSIPAAPDEVEFLFRAMRPLLYKNWAVMAFWDGKPAGFAVQAPNIAEAYEGREKGTFHPSFIARLALRRWRTSRVPLLCVRPDLHRTRAGAAVAGALLLHTAVTAQAAGVEAVDYSWMLEDNAAILNLVGKMPSAIHKTYAIYQKDVAA